MSRTTQTLEESAYQRFVSGPFTMPICVNGIFASKIENGIMPGDFFVTWHNGRAGLFMAEMVDDRWRTVRTAGDGFDFNLEGCQRVKIAGCQRLGRYLSADYAKVAATPVGYTIKVLGFVLRRLDKQLEPGDNYIAERNTDPQLLTVRVNHAAGWIEPEERAYSYDTGECIPVEVVDVA